MVDNCEWIFRLFGRHPCKSRIFERMDNFPNDCCRPWTKKPFKNSCSRQLRIVNAVVSRSPPGQIDWPKSVFLQDKVTLFETMMTTKVVYVMLTIFTIMLILYAHKMLLLCSKSPTIMLKMFPRSLIFAHGCYVTSMSVEGNRMALDHSLTHSLTRFWLIYSLKPD